MATKKCILCYKDCALKRLSPKEETNLKHQVNTIFIVKTLLEVSDAVSADLLTKNGNPSTWGIAFCPSCNEMIVEGTYIHKQIVYFRKQLKAVGDKCRNKIRQSLELQKSRTNNSSHPVDKVRAQFAQQKDSAKHQNEQPVFLEVPEKYEIFSDGPEEEEDDGDNNELDFLISEDKEIEVEKVNSLSEDTALVTPSSSRPQRPRRSPAKYTDTNVSSKTKSISEEEYDEEIEPERWSDHELPFTDLITIRPEGKSESSETEDSDSDNDYKIPTKKKRRGKNNKEEDRPVYCAPCDKTFSTFLAYNGHKTMLHSGEMQCPHCQDIFSCRSKMINHFRSHELDKPYKCDKCPSTFTKSYNLVSHFRKFHENGGDEDQGEGDAIPQKKCRRKRSTTKNTTVHCVPCDITFPTHVAYHGHNSMFHSGTVQCKRCDKSFESRSLMLSHMRSHELEKNFMCDICSSIFKESRQLLIHQAKVHGTDIPKEIAEKLTCDICNVIYAHNSSLAAHKASVHWKEGDEKKFKCTVCSYESVSKHRVTVHTRHIHQNVPRPKGKALYCPEPDCSKVFHSNRNLQAHLRNKHGRETTAKIYEPARTCPICQQVLKVSKNGLLLHLNSKHGENNEVKIYRKKPRTNRSARKVGGVQKKRSTTVARIRNKARKKRVQNVEYENDEDDQDQNPIDSDLLLLGGLAD